MPRQPQEVHLPKGTIPTRAVAPQKVTVNGEYINILDYTFGFSDSNANIRSLGKLKESVYFSDLFGGTVFKDPLADKGYSILANFHPVYRNYKEFLDSTGNPTDASGNPTRNPLCLHRVRADRLDLVLRSNLSAAQMRAMNPALQNMPNLGGESDTSPYVMGFLRLPVHAVPGTYVEVLAKWNDSAQYDYVSWPVIWTFTGEQVYGTTVRYFTRKTFECDAPDGYSEGKRLPLGHSFVTGFPNGTGQKIKRLYAANSGGLMAMDGGDSYESEGGVTLEAAGGDKEKVDWNAVTRFRTSPETDPTRGFRLWGLHFHADGRTIDMFLDGKLYSRVDAPFGVKLRDAYTEHPDPPIDPARGEEWLGHHIMIGHQGLPRFNAAETQDVTTRPEGQHFEMLYSIKHIRVWRVPGGLTAQPSTRTEEAPLPAPQTGTVLGDLPALATGTYLADVSAHTGTLRDRFGNAVELLGTTKLAPAALDGLPAPEHDGTSDGGVSLRGPACARFQGAHRVYAFLAVEARNAYATRQTLMSANRDFPVRDIPGEHIGRVALTAYHGAGATRRIEARVDGASGAQSIAAAGVFSADVLEVISLVKTTNVEGRIVLGMAEHGATPIVAAPAATGGVPVADLAGITEVTFLCGRNKWGLPASPANARLVRAILVGVPDGAELSAADHAAVVAAIKAKRTA